ncbi:NADPH-dependent ferric siderophore reductase, contains FAD-binding and SIP domains [Andreprevotia lacus DSM 23236]|jgi:NADPH-dependent ferric siderophore reductase|uniref:NADPH-dependent ferric siderophore reductase, contains FAD-binding and SIP domains n=1 Tax=Andreprevotia lacus DSM 23236 TaxID=1121001 RepID=A0A1W1XRD3_9NEIS|nr:siderophore-interacting protein [Andreprevotia lacus]SMC26081.1 NADPH-dependent ferric siderophore reductase, contains FAD-binding and SIP domains [Andreprevotia lacus DSM 23236]
MANDTLAPQRVRHTLKLRLLTVKRVQALSPQLVRVTFTGDDLADFISASFDDHLKVFLPRPGETVPKLPELGPNGPLWVEGEARPIARDYTPRRFDAAANELDIEFVLHGEGPATRWAAQVQVGQQLGIGGPRGSFVIPLAYDWHLLVGDESALPAIARRLEEMPPDAVVQVVLQVADQSARIPLVALPSAQVQWLYRSDAADSAAQLASAVQQLTLPSGAGYAWAAGELTAIQAVRKVLVEHHGIDKRHIRAASYWRHGAAATHETLDD